MLCNTGSIRITTAKMNPNLSCMYASQKQLYILICMNNASISTGVMCSEIF